MNTHVSVQICLKKATSRAKSDVANKLVSMFLHEVSRRLSSELNLKVNDLVYANHVEQVFGTKCALCGCVLEKDRLAVEHLEGMNRVRLGLHIPGNVVLACKECNREKRRDDQLEHLVLADTGWGSFLSHDGSRCDPACNSCRYWRSRWPDLGERVTLLSQAAERIVAFQSNFLDFASRSASLREIIRRDVETLYRECQDFATGRIGQLSGELFGNLSAR
jgi:hypothetical protein